MAGRDGIAAAAGRGVGSAQADAVVDVTTDATSPPATKDDMESALARLRDQLRVEIYRALAVQTLILVGVVAALTRL